jgi:hypothetical protein
VTAYRVRRRAFLASLGGALGLQALLSGLEANAQGVAAPPRLLVMHWPLGTLRQRFLPAPTGNDGFASSPLLEPFELSGLHDDMIVLYGLDHRFTAIGGGGNEAGTVFAVTGANSPGTRSNGGEGDDSVAGGPSFDQIFSARAPLLSRPGVAPVNAIADARVFSQETSTQCLSYSYETAQVQSVNPGGMISEHVPLLPEKEPAALYNRLFSSLVPGDVPNAARTALLLRKSVLDSALVELRRLHALAPASEREKIDAHADAVRRLELTLQAEIDTGSANACSLPEAPDGSIVAKSGSRQIQVEDPAEEDATFVSRVGKLHAAVIRAAFQCDLARVATLQWCPGTNHVAFAGMNALEPDAIYEMGSFHYRESSSSFYSGAPPASSHPRAYVYETLTRMYAWFNQQTAEVVSELKAATDIFGGRLLDSTLVPYITEQAQPTDERSPLPALILGGRALGMQGGKLMNFAGATRSHNDLWLTIAQALLQSSDPLSALTTEKFSKSEASPIAGLWLPRA